MQVEARTKMHTGVDLHKVSKVRMKRKKPEEGFKLGLQRLKVKN